MPPPTRPDPAPCRSARDDRQAAASGDRASGDRQGQTGKRKPARAGRSARIGKEGQAEIGRQEARRRRFDPPAARTFDREGRSGGT